jgi:putative DNA primase/helicase
MADDLDFTLLSDAERKAAQGRNGELAVGRPTCPPADAEPAETAAARLFRRPPDAIWRYATAQGDTAFFVCRYNKPEGRKDFLPLCWSPGDGWRSKHWPAPRPLYNLDKITADPDALVIICEGEKSAEAAASIFPKSAATTSSAGANAASQTDWTPLRGRSARIWPDADKLGSDFASEVAAILADLECDVSIIDADALAAIDPIGGRREPIKKGWDAADALAEWPDLEALQMTAARLAKPFDAGPNYVSFSPYMMNSSGLTIKKQVGRGDERHPETLPIAASFEILGACRDPHGHGWGRCCNGAMRTGALTDGMSPTASCTAMRGRSAPALQMRGCGSIGRGSVIWLAICPRHGRKPV